MIKPIGPRFAVLAIGSARAQLEATDGIRQLDRTVGQDGKSRPARKPRKVTRKASAGATWLNWTRRG